MHRSSHLGQSHDRCCNKGGATKRLEPITALHVTPSYGDDYGTIATAMGSGYLLDKGSSVGARLKLTLNVSYDTLVLWLLLGGVRRTLLQPPWSVT